MDIRKSSAPARPPKDAPTRLVKLEEKYRHEMMRQDERLELFEEILRLRRSAGKDL